MRISALSITASTLLLIVGYLLRSKTYSLDIQIHDTYYVFSYTDLAVALSILIAVFSLIAIFISRKRANILKK